MAMQIGSHPAPCDSSTARSPCALATSIWANGMSVMASSWPDSSAFTCAEGSEKSITVTWSKYGWPERQ
jgi:hypothetical protein